MAIPRITKEALKQRLDAGDVPAILDVRLKYPYEHSTLTLPNATRVSPEEAATVTLSKDRDIVAYDSDPEELVSAQVVATLIDRGYRAAALKGGLPEWAGANLPMDTKEARRTVPPAAGAVKG